MLDYAIKLADEIKQFPSYELSLLKDFDEFVLAFYFLQMRYSYEEAIFKTQEMGKGDDAISIVGGLIGAAVGIEGISADQRKKVLRHDCSATRPKFLSIKLNF